MEDKDIVESAGASETATGGGDAPTNDGDTAGGKEPQDMDFNVFN